MTPAKQIVEGHRYWTPRLALITVCLHVGGLGLWWFVTNWMTEIKSDVIAIKSELVLSNAQQSERRIANAAWKTQIADKVENLNMRLALVETKIATP